MRMRLIAAFIVVAVLAALASAWVINLIAPFYPWLANLLINPARVQHLFYSRKPGQMYAPAPPGALAFCLTTAALLLAAIIGLAFAASRRVLLPVRRLAWAAQQLSGGDLSVRIEPRGRDELAQLVTTFNAMAETLEDKVGELQQMEARARQFAGDVSHELRTPLTALTAVAGIIHEHPGLTGDAATAARLAHQEIFHLNQLVHDLIEISRFDAGTAQLVLDETDVAIAVDRCLRTRDWAGVITDVQSGLTVNLDRRRFDVIIANLVGNALRHGEPPVAVRASVQAGDHRGEHLVLQVRDHGPGLAPADLPHVFNRFYKADNARSRSDGCGLGLAIAWENARLHGGSIDAASHPGGGAVFSLRLPLSQPQSSQATAPGGDLVHL